MALAALAGIWRGMKQTTRRLAARKTAVPPTPAAHAELMRGSWDEKAKTLNLGAISFLKDPATSWSEEEFCLVGEDSSSECSPDSRNTAPVRRPRAPASSRSAAGPGAFSSRSRPTFAGLSALTSPRPCWSAAAAACRVPETSSCTVCNGLDLSAFGDDDFDYCISAGVFQHITSTDIIMAYVREGLRVTRPGGMFLFQFQGCHTHRESGSVMSGARLTARDLDRALAGYHFRIRELSNDPADRYSTLVVVLQDSPPAGTSQKARDCSHGRQSRTSRGFRECMTALPSRQPASRCSPARSLRPSPSSTRRRMEA